MPGEIDPQRLMLILPVVMLGCFIIGVFIGGWLMRK